MESLDKLIEGLLTEALSSKSKQILANNKLVPDLAATMRDDVMSNPSAFPAGSKATFKKASDQELANWFLENLDSMEREGYEGVLYSRNGDNNEWIVRRYIAGAHSWEDITGVMGPNLRDWKILQTRDMLDANHINISKFKSIRDLGYYMTTHYEAKLKDLRNIAKFAGQDKLAKTVKLVDNDDYRIFTVLNRWGGVVIGRGTQWCTANSNTDGNFFAYASTGMLFEIFPYMEQTNAETGEPELVRNSTLAYQCDAGDRGPNFKNIVDVDPNKEQIRTTYPFLYNDIKTALAANAGKIEAIIAGMKEDPKYKDRSFAPVEYNIPDQIARLDKLLARGWFTEKVRPKERAHAEEPAQGQPQIGDAPAQPPQEPQMESIRDLARAMLEDVTLGHIVQSFRPHNQDGEESPMTHGEDNLDEEEVDECGDAKARLAQALGGQGGMVDEADISQDEPYDEYSHGDESELRTGSNKREQQPWTNPNYREPERPESRYGRPPVIQARYNSHQRGDKIQRLKVGQHVCMSLGGDYTYVGLITDIVPDGAVTVTPVDGVVYENKQKVDKLRPEEIKPKTISNPRQSEIMYVYDSTSKQGRIPDGYSLEEDDAMMQDAGGDVGAQAATGGGGSLGSMGGGGGGHYAPGTAPTMPESIQIKESKMKNVDKDVAAMLNSLKKYDKLNESVLGMTTVGMARPQQVNEISDQLANKAYNARVGNYQDAKTDTTKAKARTVLPSAPGQSRAGDVKTATAQQANAGSKLNKSANLNIRRTAGQQNATDHSDPQHDANLQQFTNHQRVSEEEIDEAGPAKHEIPAAFRKEKGGDWKTTTADLEKDANKSPTTKKGLEDLKAKKDIKETADPEILAWMNRFSKLGNMKGYGR